MSSKLKFYCGKLKQCATRSHTPSQRGASVPGKEVIGGKLWMKKGKKAKLAQVHVAVFCGSREPETSARVEITDESARSSQRLRVIPLVDVKPDVGVSSTPPLLSCASPGHSSRQKISFLSKAESEKTYFPVQLVLLSGEVVEFLFNSEEGQKKWVQRLNLLLMFPFSPIPYEPTVNLAMAHMFRAQINPRDYKGDSVWGVYIFPEEVGARTHILGLNFLVLLSEISEGQKGRIDVVSPMDVQPRLVSWNREFIRRVGHLGNLSFIEIGRRCTGGPGLVWLYAGPEKAESLRLTLHQFLYRGNAHCVCTGEPNGWPTICDDERSPALPPSPAVTLGQRNHKPDGMSSSQDNLLLHTDSKHPSPVVSWKEEDEAADRQRWMIQRWMQSGVKLGQTCEDGCPEDH